MSSFNVSPERRAAASSARRTVLIVAAVLAAAGVGAFVAFPPGGDTRASLSIAAIVLVALAGLMVLRLVQISRKADGIVGAGGEVLALEPGGIRVAGDTVVPWDVVSGVWASDNGPALRRRAASPVLGWSGRLMLASGTNTANLLIGITDAARMTDPAARAKRFKALPSGMTPARIELPFGSWFDTDALLAVLGEARGFLPAEVPARMATGNLDYAAAWAGAQDDVATIRAREAEHS